MKKFEGILICTDLDGTLLRNDKSISPENLKAIEYFKAEGGLFTFITGRIPLSAADVYNVVQPNIPFGCFNGGGIYDHRKQDYLWMDSLPEEVLELVEYVDRNMPEVGIHVNAARHPYFNKDSSALVKFRKVTGLPNLTCHYRDVKEPIAKIIFGDEKEENILRLMQLLNDHPQSVNYSFIRSEHDLYEILPKGVSKGSVLQKIVELLHIDPDKTIAIGDYDNDVAMLRNARLGVAVSNASDAAKAAADYITVSNEEHALARIITDLEEGILPIAHTLNK